MKLAVSILSSNYNLEKTIEKVNNTQAEFFHIDVMDGKFVIKEFDPFDYLKLCTKPLNVHFMVKDPFSYIIRYSVYKPDMMIIPYEITDDIKGLLELIKRQGVKAGIAIKPETSVDEIRDYLSLVDEVLVMTVNPGMGGQKLIVETLDKVDKLDKLRRTYGLQYIIGVDGGINLETIKDVANADLITVGSYICKSEDYNKRIENLKNVFKN